MHIIITGLLFMLICLHDEICKSTSKLVPMSCCCISVVCADLVLLWTSTKAFSTSVVLKNECIEHKRSHNSSKMAKSKQGKHDYLYGISVTFVPHTPKEIIMITEA